MPSLPTLLIALGLGLDVIGAGILALPDFPFVRRKTHQGEIETAIYQMESSGLRPQHPDYQTVKQTLEEIYNIDIGNDIEGIRVGLTTLKRNLEQEIYIYRTDEDSYSPDGGPGWILVRSSLLGQAAESEMKFRRTGFGLLGIGFMLQIVGTFL